jgi:tellurite resistance protein TerC
LDVPSVAGPGLWTVTLLGIAALFALDLALTRRPHAVEMREAVRWSCFYVALPVAFGVWLWSAHGSERGLEFFTGYLVEKSLSVDNLFVFLLLLTAFAVPRELQQRVLLYGIVGALVLRGVFIALGAAALASLSWAFLLFGAILLATAVKIGREALSGHQKAVDVGSMRVVRLLRRVMPVSEEWAGPRLTVQVQGRRALTPFALVVAAVLAPTSCSPSTPCRRSTASRPTRTSCSSPTPSPCSACEPSTSCCRARSAASSTSRTGSR